MVWAEPQHSRGQVDRAGAVLVDDHADGDDLIWALEVINNWRSAHGFPLNTFQGTLRKKARVFDQSAIVAQRTKRLASIDAKLRNEPWLKLSKMQDIGGCRAILNSVANVTKLIESYDESDLKHKLTRRDNYIDMPRGSGYRSVHLIYHYFSDKKSTYNGLQIEMQVRSSMQHAWATAVETVGTLLSQSLKSSQGSDDWLRFFALMGAWMAIRERTAPVPDTPTSETRLKRDIRSYAKRLDVEGRLRAYAAMVQLVEQPMPLIPGHRG